MDTIAYTVRIRENTTGKEVDYRDDWKCWDDDPTGVRGIEFMYSEGNYSCDCNREMFFCRAAGIEEPEDCKCGEGRFSVRIVIDATGKVVLDEFAKVFGPVAQ